MRQHHSNEAYISETEPQAVAELAYDAKLVNSINLKHHHRLMKPLQMSERTKVQKEIARSLRMASLNPIEGYDPSKDVTLIALKSRVKEIATISKAHDRLCHNAKVQGKKQSQPRKIEDPKDMLNQYLKIAKERLSEKGFIDIVSPTLGKAISTEPFEIHEAILKSKSPKKNKALNKDQSSFNHSQRKLLAKKEMEGHQLSNSNLAQRSPSKFLNLNIQTLHSTAYKTPQKSDSPLEILNNLRKKVTDVSPRSPSGYENSTLKLHQTASTFFNTPMHNQHTTSDVQESLESAKFKSNMITPIESVRSAYKISPIKKKIPDIQIELERNKSSPYIFGTPEEPTLKPVDLSSGGHMRKISAEKLQFGFSDNTPVTKIKSDFLSGRTLNFDIEEEGRTTYFKKDRNEIHQNMNNSRSFRDLRAKLLQNIESARVKMHQRKDKSLNRSEDTRGSTKESFSRHDKPADVADAQDMYKNFVTFYKKTNKRKPKRKENLMHNDIREDIKDVIAQNYNEVSEIEKPDASVVSTSIVRR
jgi:hypothetical protein